MFHYAYVYAYAYSVRFILALTRQMHKHKYADFELQTLEVRLQTSDLTGLHDYCARALAILIVSILRVNRNELVY